MSRRTTTKWNFFFFYVRTTIGLFNGLLVVPLYLKYIDHTLFGLWLASGNILTWITIMDPGVGDVLVQKVAAAFSKSSKNKLQYILSASILISFIVSLFALALTFLFAGYLDTILAVTDPKLMEELSLAFKINAIATCITLFSYCLTGTILGFQRTRELGIIQTITGLLGIAATLTFLFTGQGLLSISYSSMIKSCLSMLLYILVIKNIFGHEQIGYAFSKRHFRMLTNLYALTFSRSFFRTIGSNIDLVIVSRLLGPASVMMLEITRRPIKIAQNFVNIPSQSLLPAFSNLYGEGNREKINALVTRFLVTFFPILCLFVGGFALFNDDLLTVWVGSEFFIGTGNNIILCLGFFVATFCYNLSNLTYCMGEIKANSVIEIVKNILSIIILYPLVKYFGVTGAVLAFLIAPLFTEAWYYPGAVLRKTDLTTSDKNSVTRTLLKGIAIVIALGIFFFPFTGSNWLILIAQSLLFVILFVTAYLFIDKNVRTEFAAMANSVTKRFIRQ